MSHPDGYSCGSIDIGRLMAQVVAVDNAVPLAPNEWNRVVIPMALYVDSRDSEGRKKALIENVGDGKGLTLRSDDERLSDPILYIGWDDQIAEIDGTNTYGEEDNAPDQS